MKIVSVLSFCVLLFTNMTLAKDPLPELEIQKILFGGCFVKPEGLGNFSHAVIEEWPASVDKLIARYSSATLVVPGHGKIGDASLLEKTKQRALEATAAKK